MNITNNLQIKNIIKKITSITVFVMVLLSLVPFTPVSAKMDFSFFDLFSFSAASAEKRDTFPVSQDRKPVNSIWVSATAYNSLAGQTDDTPCIPAMWKFDLCEFYEENGFGNTIAANFLPLGTQVQFPDLYGDKIFIVRDRMNKRYGHGRVDIWLPEYGEARIFGLKRTKMNIYN